MFRYQLTADAKNDLKLIRSYSLENWGQAQTVEYLNELKKSIKSLCQFPLQGTLRPELAEDVRSFPSGSHVIYYFVSNENVTVYAILHGKMAPQYHLKNRTI